MKLVSVTLLSLFAALYAGFLYLQLATASIYPSYQPQIGRVRWFSPSLLLVVVIATTLVLARRGRLAPRYSLVVAKVALAVLAAMWAVAVFLAAGSGARPIVGEPGESLSATLQQALLNPHLSNRSYGSLLWATLLSGLALGITARFRRRLSRLAGSEPSGA